MRINVLYSIHRHRATGWVRCLCILQGSVLVPRLARRSFFVLSLYRIFEEKSSGFVKFCGICKDFAKGGGFGAPFLLLRRFFSSLFSPSPLLFVCFFLFFSLFFCFFLPFLRFPPAFLKAFCNNINVGAGQPTGGVFVRPEGQRVRITAACRPFRFTGARSKKARSSGVSAVSGFRVGILQTSCVKLAFCKVFAVCWRFVNFLRRDWQFMYRLMSRRAPRKLIYSGPMFAQSFLGWRYAYLSSDPSSAPGYFSLTYCVFCSL